MRNLIFIVFAILSFYGLNAQELEKKWQFKAIQDQQGKDLVAISDSNFLELKKGSFNYELAPKNNLKASGDYIYQNNRLIFYYKLPTDTIRHYRIETLTDSTLVFSENTTYFSFKVAENNSRFISNVAQGI